MKITAQVNHTKTAFAFDSEYNKMKLLQWFKVYKNFTIQPIVKDSVKGRRYLEGAVIPEYVEWQYGIDAREPTMHEARRLLFKRDFNYEIVSDREGNPQRIPISSKGKVRDILDRWSEWASENGCRIPNPELFKLWRDQYKERFDTFHHFLRFLDLECDAMPSVETLAKLKEGKKKMPAYPEDPYNGQGPTI